MYTFLHPDNCNKLQCHTRTTNKKSQNDQVAVLIAGSLLQVYMLDFQVLLDFTIMHDERLLHALIHNFCTMI